MLPTRNNSNRPTDLPTYRPKPGVTLVETLIVIGVMTTMLVIIVEIFLVNYDIVRMQSGRVDTDTGAAIGVRQVSEAARGATAVVVSQTIDGTLYTTADTTLVLKIPSLDSNKNVIAGQFDYVAIHRDPVETTKIFSATQPGLGSVRLAGKHLLTAYNQTMYFRYNDADQTKADRVSVYLVNQQTVLGTTLTTRAWASLFMRNYE